MNRHSSLYTYLSIYLSLPIFLSLPSLPINVLFFHTDNFKCAPHVEQLVITPLPPHLNISKAPISPCYPNITPVSPHECTVVSNMSVHPIPAYLDHRSQGLSGYLCVCVV